MALKIGQQAWIRCKVQPGPFSDEPLVTIETIDGPVSGFIGSDELKEEDGRTMVLGIVRAIERDSIEVWIRGSFFTTNGLANVTHALATAAQWRPMILAQPEIRAAVDKGEIRFDPPLEEKQWHEASVDLRLGLKFTKLVAKKGVKVTLAHGIGAIADAGLWQEKALEEKDVFGKKETFTIDPGEFVLAQTYERIWVPRHLIAMVEGRSSYARAGLSMHQTAPWIQPNWNGHITLEIRNSGPLEIERCPIIDMPCQLTFFQLTSVPETALHPPQR